jgi:hypothetical protein
MIRIHMLDSLKSWHAYFSNNRSSTGNIPWNIGDVLTDDEKTCIKNSIAAFQLGEYSEGKGLLKSAEQYSRKLCDEYLVQITKLFISEEQNHALILKRFMDSQRIEPIRKNWTDAVFRRLRKNVGYEITITVLITAEIIALVYYRALKNATNSKLLKCICDKILADEVEHVKYESEMIDYIRDGKPTLVKHSTALLHQVLFLGTIIVVYLNHKRVLKRGGYDFSEFLVACWSEFSKYLIKRMVVQVPKGA